jgi:hypothetical protein
LVNKSNSVATLSSGLNPSVGGQAITFTATVDALAPGSGIPTGTVTFQDATASLGTSSLDANGQATLTVTNFTSGAHSITATYTGDADFAGTTTSAATSQVVMAPDFSLSVSSGQPVNAGALAVYTITVSPLPAPFLYAVTNFTCTGLPTGAACDFNPMVVTPNNNSVTTTLTIRTTSRAVALAIPSSKSPRPLFAVWLSTGMLGLCGIVAMSNKRQRRSAKMWIALALLGSAVAVGCTSSSQGNSNSSNPNGTPAGTYNVTLQASGNGNTTHTTAVVLKVN